VFTSTLWKDLAKQSETTLNTSSSYHPQTDGQTERLNQCLETYLHCMIHSCPNKWSQWLPLAEFCYNTSTHSGHGKTLVEVLYGHQPRHFGISADLQCLVPDLDQWLQDRANMNDIIRQNLLRAQQHMKQQANKKRQERTFEVGDWVYVKLQPHIQTSVAKRPNHKLSYKFFGPYPITQKVGAVAYKLQLPSSSQIHPVIHASQLKKALPPNAQVTPDDALHCLMQTKVCTPVQVLNTRMQRVGNKIKQFDLVQSDGLPQHWATWENCHKLRSDAPLLSKATVG
jgi:hypothetical protein